MTYDVLILGAGPAGIMTALSFLNKKPDRSVLLLESGDAIGGKIPASGNGRCNFTNRDVAPSDYLTSSSPETILRVLADQPVVKTLDFFASLGLVWREEEGRLYPASFEAKTLLNLLELRLDEVGAEVVRNVRPSTIYHRDSLWHYGPYQAKHFVLACGSPAGKPTKNYQKPSFPELDWIAWSPALVPIECKDFFKRLSGTRIPAHLTAYGQQGCTYSQGTVLFTNYGLSGIASLDLASTLLDLQAIHDSSGNKKLRSTQFIAEKIYGAASKNSPYLICLNFFPEWSDDMWNLQISKRIRHSNVDLGGLLPMKLQFLIEDLWSKLIKQGEKPEQLFRGLLGAFPFLYRSLRSFEFAQVARGGLRLDDWESTSLEHKDYPGLYAVGEILDVVGHCGGFNLQWAWSSAQQVGQAISRSPRLERKAP